MQERDGVVVAPIERVRRGEFPTNPRGRLSALLGAFNGTPKAVTFLLIPQVGAIIQQDLANKFIETFSGTPLEEFDPITTWSYMDTTLLPIGLVTERVEIGPNGYLMREVAFERTPAGEKYGVPAATLALDFEKRHEISLRKILGKTASPSKDKVKAPFVRASILLFLAERQTPLRRQDIIDELGFNSSVVSAALESLGKNGLVNYSSVSRSEKGIVGYEIVPEADIPSSNRPRPFTDNIISICQRLSYFGVPFTTYQVRQLMDETELGRWTSEYALGNFIKKVLSYLTRMGYLRRTQFKGGEKYSDAMISPDGRVLVDEFLKPLVALVEDKPEADAIRQNVVPAVTGDFTGYARNSAELYYPYSTSKRMDENATDFVNIMNLIKSGKGISVREISEALQLERSTVINHIRTMQRLYSLVYEQRGVIKYFSIEPTFKSHLQEIKIPPGIKRIVQLLDTNQEIGLEDKVSLLIYATWAKYGSTKKTAEVLKTTEEKVRSVLDQIQADERLIQVYDLITKEKPEEDS
ncbi:MAG: helix-turn-helix transcriptional regulator [Candidatus Levybacteria bacterium]|nr:helix-turn-helix transcriptional regulator [Candidatus Levybacteria bacterium]